MIAYLGSHEVSYPFNSIRIFHSLSCKFISRHSSAMQGYIKPVEKLPKNASEGTMLIGPLPQRITSQGNNVTVWNSTMGTQGFMSTTHKKLLAEIWCITASCTFQLLCDFTELVVGMMTIDIYILWFGRSKMPIHGYKLVKFMPNGIWGGVQG